MSTKVKFPCLSSNIAISAGAPTFSVPLSRKNGNTLEGFRVEDDTTAFNGIPKIKNYDMILGKSLTPGALRLVENPSVEIVSGQKPAAIIASKVSQRR